MLTFTTVRSFGLISSLADIKNYNYGQEHPMKPKRVAMAHDLIEKYGMYHDMKVYVSSIYLAQLTGFRGVSTPLMKR